MAKVTQKLTPLGLKAEARPGAKPFKLSDGAGLFLLVNPNGACYWRLAYRFGGQQKLLALGVYPLITLASARAKAAEARLKIADGTDPSAERKAVKTEKAAVVAAEVAEAAKAAQTFKVVALEWLSKQARKSAGTTMTKARWMLEAFAFPMIGERALDSVETPDLLAVLRTLEARGKLETASRLQQRMSAIFRYAIACGYVTRNPAADLKGAIEAAETVHRAAITQPQKIGQLLRAIEDFDGYLITQFALKLAALLFVRPGELRGAPWSEFDMSAAVWRIDAARMKMKAAHDVPLSKQALEILRQLQALTGAQRLLFPGVRTHERPISENTLNAALRRLGFTSDEMTAHGFRAMASTRLNEMNLFHRDAIERQLAHKEPNKTRGAYDRSQHWEERVRMMQVWADYLDTLRAGGNVVPLRKTG